MKINSLNPTIILRHFCDNVHREFKAVFGEWKCNESVWFWEEEIMTYNSDYIFKWSSDWLT